VHWTFVPGVGMAPEVTTWGERQRIECADVKTAERPTAGPPTAAARTRLGAEERSSHFRDDPGKKR
jgi:hypothetical protein